MERIPALDGLRGVAILLVVAAHVGLPGNGGSVGVTLFFVLSGFLITSLLVNELDDTSSIRLKRFYRRRAYRLLPALAVYLTGAAIIALLMGHSLGWVWAGTWAPLFYVSNYAMLLGSDIPMNWHTWSLSVEEHFYLIWPLLVLMIPKSRRTEMMGLALCLLMIWTMMSSLISPEWAHSATDTNASALAAGCLISVAKFRWRVPVWAPFLGAVGLVAATVISEFWIRQPLVILVSALTIWACANTTGSLLVARPLRFMGRISYALYLWHVPLLMAAGQAIGTRVAAAIGSAGIAWMSWTLVERPMLRRADRPPSGWVYPRVTKRFAVVDAQPLFYAPDDELMAAGRSSRDVDLDRFVQPNPVDQEAGEATALIGSRPGARVRAAC